MARTADQLELPLLGARPIAAAEGLSTDRIWSDDGWLVFAYRRSRRRRTLSINVFPDARVVVAVPNRVSVAEIRAFVGERARWISKARRHFEQLRQSQRPRRFLTGERHPYLGKSLVLVLRRSEFEEVTMQGGALKVAVPYPADESHVELCVSQWYREQANAVIPAKFHRRWLGFRASGESPPKLTLKRMKTRWGSCNPGRRISLNQALVKLPPVCIDYVIVHELCHLREPHHGPAFWALVGKILPNYADLRKQMNRVNPAD